MKRIIAVAGAVLALAACAPSDAPHTQPATASSSSPTPSGTPLTEIPPAAFLQPDDLGPGDVLTEGMVLEAWLNICQGALLDSNASVAAQTYVGFRYYYSGNRRESDGYGYEVITSYRPGGAEGYLAEVRDLVAGPCARAENEESIVEQTIVAEGFGGDDSVRIRRLDTWKPNGKVGISYVSVSRFGDVVVFLSIAVPWDGSDHAPYFDRIEAAAVGRAVALS